MQQFLHDHSLGHKKRHEKLIDILYMAKAFSLLNRKLLDSATIHILTTVNWMTNYI